MSEKDPNTIEISVSEDVKLSEAHPGGGTPAVEETDKKEKGPTEEEIKAYQDLLQKVLERKVFLSEQYCVPHNKKSRRVKQEDVARVVEAATLMHEMCMVGRGEYTTAYAIAHSQIEAEDPLRFFVTAEGQIFINPVIVDHGHEITTVREGCMSFPEEPMKTTLRWKDVTVKYRTLSYKENPETGEPMNDEKILTREITSRIQGEFAQVFQHECQHLNGSNVYDHDASITKALNE